MNVLDTIESIENSHDITVSSFPLRRDLLQIIKRLSPERQNPERWNAWYDAIFRTLNVRLGRFRMKSEAGRPCVKRGIFKGMTYENARIASFFLRHAKVRKEYTFGHVGEGGRPSWSEGGDVDHECVNVIYTCIVFPTPGQLDFRHNGTNIELFQNASGRILSSSTMVEPTERAVVHGENVLRDFLEDVHGATEAQLSGRTADFTWEQFKDAFEPFLIFQINEDYATRVR